MSHDIVHDMPCAKLNHAMHVHGNIAICNIVVDPSWSQAASLCAAY